jgi:hypothetical protein
MNRTDIGLWIARCYELVRRRDDERRVVMGAEVADKLDDWVASERNVGLRGDEEWQARA